MPPVAVHRLGEERVDVQGLLGQSQPPRLHAEEGPLRLDLVGKPIDLLDEGLVEQGHAALLLGLLQKLNMTAVDEVETAVGEHHRFPQTFGQADDAFDFFGFQN